MFKAVSARLKKYLYFVNDNIDVDEQKALDDIKINNQFSTSYILLLTSSAVIATLGLLQNSGPIIIGGMIISPLMWPLLNTSSAIAYDRNSVLKKAISLLIFSILITLLTSFIITVISPLNGLTDEILSRTNPILPDILIALAGGLIASYGLLHSRISQGLAGVAIATSLMPPLCVVGIGLALNQLSISSSAFILFITNCVAIVFISTIIFVFQNFKKNDLPNLVKKRGFLFLTIALIGLAIPLYIFMQDYIFDLNVANKVESVLIQNLNEGTKNAEVSNVRLIESENDILYVTADIISGNNLNLTFSDELEIKNDILEVINKNKIIKLQLRQQNELSILSQEEINNQGIIKNIEESTASVIAKFNETIQINSLQLSKNNEIYNINATIYVNPQTTINLNDIEDLNTEISKLSNQQTDLQLTILPLFVLNEADEDQTEDEIITQEVVSEIEEYIESVSDQIDINLVEILNNKDKNINGDTLEKEETIYNINIRITATNDTNIDIEEVNNIASNTLEGEIKISLTKILKEINTLN